MVSRFLVTTALEETWPVEDQPTVFLGEWCCLHGRRIEWKKRDVIVAPYHWDNRKKIKQDYDYLKILHEELLVDLAKELNTFHCINKSIRYWRIIIGPWLGYFIQMLFDRSEMLSQVVKNYDISGVRIIESSGNHMIPNDMDEFRSMYTNDVWNESIYGEILDWMRFPTHKIYKINVSHIYENKKSFVVNRRKKIYAKIGNYISEIFSRHNDYFFISTYLGFKREIYLQMRLGQIPKKWTNKPVPRVLSESEKRKWTLPMSGSGTDFSSLARKLLPKHIPIAYLEGYQSLVNLTLNLTWPKTPKAIFTSNSYSNDDVFKAWAAEKVECGIPLVIGQHGGNYGMSLWNFTEEHQIAISDHFLTWGWSTPKEQNKIIPIGMFKAPLKKVITMTTGNAVLIEMTLPRYSYDMYSVPVAAGQWLEYHEEQIRFVRALSDRLQEQLVIRLFLEDYGYEQKKRWKENFPRIMLDDGDKPLSLLIKKSRLIISTYNATTYIESISQNIPTLIFWNPNHWELRQSANPIIEKLKSVGIYHENPESAAHFMETIWDDIFKWWNSELVQLVRQEFCSVYAKKPEQTMKKLVNLFSELGNTN